MKISYRIDDISNYMHNDNFLKIVSLFKKYNIKPLLGVIPNNEDNKLHRFGKVKFNFWKKIKELKNIGWSISMHGGNHVYENSNSGILKYPKKSEFAGLSIENQRKKIKEGKKIMIENKLETDIFMAPSHSFDNITLKVLEEEGFNYVTDGLFLENFKLNGHNIIFIPQVSSKVIPGFLKIQTICLHPNNWTENDFILLENEIIKYKNKIVNFEELLNIQPKNYSKLVGNIILHLKTKGRLFLSKI